jgi:hypothetical protein
MRSRKGERQGLTIAAHTEIREGRPPPGGEGVDGSSPLEGFTAGDRFGRRTRR